MSWVKQIFTDFVTVINAAFLNGIQDQLISDEETLSGKVDKVQGKGLSTNDYTDAEKTKLAGKVDKRTASGEEVYTHDGSTQGGRSVSATPSAGAVPIYNSDGRLKANAPSANNDVLRKYEHDKLIGDLEAGTEATANLHLGFYLDANGDLCQVEEE